MKNFICLLFCFTCFNVFGQELSVLSEDPYKKCLELAISNNLEFIYKDTIFVRKATYLQNLEGVVRGKYILLLDENQILSRTKDAKPIGLVVVHPIEFRKDGMFVFVTDFGVVRKRKKYSFVNNGFVEVQLVFNCERTSFDYKIVSEH